MKSQSSLSITDDWVAGGNRGKTSFIEREKERLQTKMREMMVDQSPDSLC